MIRNPYSSSNTQTFNQTSAPVAAIGQSVTRVMFRQIDNNHRAITHITRGHNGRMRAISTCVLTGQSN